MWTIQVGVDRQSRQHLRSIVIRHKIILNTETVVKIMGVIESFLHVTIFLIALTEYIVFLISNTKVTLRSSYTAEQSNYYSFEISNTRNMTHLHIILRNTEKMTTWVIAIIKMLKCGPSYSNR